ncbi:MAG: hypothetical protein JW832_09710 [Deltaproteobacteria bacterium]|nr:hypothetical protein [Deltaproteobacteria bacterium]
MKIEVKTLPELVQAILHNIKEICIVDAALASRMLSRPRKLGFVSYAMLANGYRLNTLRALGVIKVSLIKRTQEVN